MKRNVIIPSISVSIENGQVMYGFRQGAIIWNWTIPVAILYYDHTILDNFSIEITRNNNFHNEVEKDISYLEGIGQVSINKFSSDLDYTQSCTSYMNNVKSRISSFTQEISTSALFPIPRNESPSITTQLYFGADSEFSKKVAIEIDLINALPIPPLNTPYDDILNFKEQRSSELQELQNHVGKLSYTFSNAGNIEVGVRDARAQMEPILSALAKVTQETWPARILGSIKIELGNFSRNAIVGGIIGSTFGEPILGGIAGAAHGSISALIKNSLEIPYLPDGAGPFAYSFLAQRAF